MTSLWLVSIFILFTPSCGKNTLGKVPMVPAGLASDKYCPAPSTPSCSVVPSAPSQGSFEQSVDPLGSPILFFFCKVGFLLMGQDVLTCNCTTHWSHPFPKCAAIDCQAHYDSGRKKSGVYGIIPDGHNVVFAFCDMDIEKRGWTIIQRRMDSSVDFNRDWESYKHGFGNPRGNLWIGLDNIYHLTTLRSQLRITLKAGLNDHAFAIYDHFRVSDERMKYQLSISGYHGNAGDALISHADGQKFSTFDSDNDSWAKNCAIAYHGGWWFKECYHAHLNGLYGMNASVGIVWYPFKGNKLSLPFVEMKIRRY